MTYQRDYNEPTLGTVLASLLTDHPEELEGMLTRLCRREPIKWNVKNQQLESVASESNRILYDRYSLGGNAVKVYDPRARTLKTYARQPDHATKPGSVTFSHSLSATMQVLSLRGWTLVKRDYKTKQQFTGTSQVLAGLEMSPPMRLCSDCPHLLTCALEGTLGE